MRPGEDLDVLRGQCLVAEPTKPEQDRTGIRRRVIDLARVSNGIHIARFLHRALWSRFALVTAKALIPGKSRGNSRSKFSGGGVRITAPAAGAQPAAGEV